ncbi:MAG: protein translocase subunit SecDF [Lewinellaceae bacterium]|nr:protein translocase subunit SecDF [Saprospiraceae bacterium]MCB9342130.1 protein translocase subunit SecDF [Lewinellaceae bacterium]
MQSKGIVRFFLIALTIVCLYQYLLIIPTSNVEAKANQYADEAYAQNPDSSRNSYYSQYLDSRSGDVVFEIPFIKKFTYADLKKSQLAMGLDLKGGMSVLLQVDLRDFLIAYSGNSTDEAFKKSLDRASELQTSQQADYITLFAQAWQELGGGRTLASIFARNETSGIKFDTPDADVINTLRTSANGTVSQTYDLLKKRIDKLGVVQPNVSLDAARDLIQVELPGIDNPERARIMLQNQAKLEFWETYRISDEGIIKGLTDADLMLAASGDTISTVAQKDTIYEFPAGPDGQPDSTQEKVMKVVDKAPAQREAGPLLQLLGINQQGGSAVIAWVDKNKIRVLEDYFKRDDVKAKFPSDVKFLFSRKAVENETEAALSTLNGKYELYAIKKRPGSDIAPLDGSVVKDAGANPDPNSGDIQVSLQMDNDGARIWAEMTTKAANAGNREIAIVLDDEVVSAPRVINPITGGNSSITGGFSLDEAKDLAQILQVGKLPARTHIVQESQVGPSLGADNINKSLITMLLSVVFLCLFMVAYYNRGGWVAVIALLANIFFILGTLASLGTVLTLPGIAGIVLTLATAVDANVIIYERIREELRDGLPMVKAVATGFTRALSAIIDANVTTMLVAVVLIYFGLGPIKGFGTVLAIGIISSMFTAVLVGRYMTDWWLDKGRSLTYSFPWSEKWLVGFEFDWMGRRKFAYIFSAAIILVGVASYFTRGFELGVDFKGGYSFNVEFDQPTTLTQLSNSLSEAFGSNTIIKTVSGDNTYNITTPYLINETGPDVTDRVIAKLHEGIQAAGVNANLDEFKKTDGKGTHIISSSQVGPTVADDIRKSSLWSGIWALGLIFLYLLVRFNRWQFSLGAVLALLHDVLITLTFFTLLHGLVGFSLEIDQALIACILTVIGFSVNDTVIVYDRIREFMGQYAGRSKYEVFNMAINTTLSRTLITSGTIFLVVILLFVFGGGAIKGFAFGILVGIFFGTYSSIFVASALVVDFLQEDVIQGKSVTAKATEDKEVKPAKAKKAKA